MPPGMTTRQFINKSFNQDIQQFTKKNKRIQNSSRSNSPIYKTNLSPRQKSIENSPSNTPRYFTSKRGTNARASQLEMNKTSTQKIQQQFSPRRSSQDSTIQTPRDPSPQNNFRLTKQHRKKNLPSSTLQSNKLQFILNRYISKKKQTNVGEIFLPTVDGVPKHLTGRIDNPLALQIERLNKLPFKKVEVQSEERGIMKRNKLLLQHVMHQRTKDKNMSDFHAYYFDQLRTAVSTMSGRDYTGQEFVHQVNYEDKGQQELNMTGNFAQMGQPN